MYLQLYCNCYVLVQRLVEKRHCGLLSIVLRFILIITLSKLNSIHGSVSQLKTLNGHQFGTGRISYPSSNLVLLSQNVVSDVKRTNIENTLFRTSMVYFLPIVNTKLTFYVRSSNFNFNQSSKQ